jgi:hypothetical protein
MLPLVPDEPDDADTTVNAPLLVNVDAPEPDARRIDPPDELALPPDDITTRPPKPSSPPETIKLRLPAVPPEPSTSPDLNTTVPLDPDEDRPLTIEISPLKPDDPD